MDRFLLEMVLLGTATNGLPKSSSSLKFSGLSQSGSLLKRSGHPNDVAFITCGGPCFVKSALHCTTSRSPCIFAAMLLEDILSRFLSGLLRPVGCRLLALGFAIFANRSRHTILVSHPSSGKIIYSHDSRYQSEHDLASRGIVYLTVISICVYSIRVETPGSQVNCK